MIPSCDHVGTPGFVAFTHLISSTTSGSADLISSRTRRSVSPRQSSISASRWSFTSDADRPSSDVELVMTSCLRNAHEVAGGVAERAVARSPRLGCRLLEHLRARCPDLLEGGVEVVRAEDGRLHRPLRHQAQQGVALGRRTTTMRLGQHDVDVLARCPDSYPAEAMGCDVVADLEAECVPIEDEGFVGVVDRDEHGGDGDCHASTLGRGPPRCFFDSARSQAVAGVRRGRVTTMLTHAGTTSRSLWSRARYRDGVSPTISVNRELNEPNEVQPTATHASVTDMPCRSKAWARSMRRVMRYAYGVSPYVARNLREKCAGDMSAVRAIAGTSRGCA